MKSQLMLQSTGMKKHQEVEGSGLQVTGVWVEGGLEDEGGHLWAGEHPEGEGGRQPMVEWSKNMKAVLSNTTRKSTL